MTEANILASSVKPADHIALYNVKTWILQQPSIELEKFKSPSVEKCSYATRLTNSSSLTSAGDKMKKQTYVEL